MQAFYADSDSSSFLISKTFLLSYCHMYVFLLMIEPQALMIDLDSAKSGEKVQELKETDLGHLLHRNIRYRMRALSCDRCPK